MTQQWVMHKTLFHTTNMFHPEQTFSFNVHAKTFLKVLPVAGSILALRLEMFLITA